MKSEILRRIVSMLEEIEDVESLNRILELVQHFFVRGK